MDDVPVVQPLDAVLRQALPGVVCHGFHQLLVHPPLRPNQAHRSAAQPAQPPGHHFLVLDWMLGYYSRWNGQGRAVELLDELSDDHAGRVVLRPFHEEVLAPDELALAYEENFHPRLGGTLGQGNDVHARLPRVVPVNLRAGVNLDAAFLGYPLHGLDAVAQHRRPLELQPLGGLGHVLFQVLGDGLGVSLHEHDDLVNDLRVVLAAGVPGAGSHAAVDVILQAGAWVVAGDGLGAGTVGEEPLHQVHGLADSVGRCERPEVAGAVLGNPAGDVDAGEVFVEVYLEVGVGLVVLQAGVVAGFVALDKRVFQYQRLRLGAGDDVLEVVDMAHHAARLVGLGGRRAEVGTKAVTKHAGLADVQHRTPDVLHQVNAGTFRCGLKPLLDEG